MVQGRHPKPTQEREPFYYDQRDDFFLRADRSGARDIHLARGNCDELVEGDDGEAHRCGYRSSFRKITDDGVTDFCGIHVPEAVVQEAKESGPKSWDAIPLFTPDEDEEVGVDGCKVWVEDRVDRSDLREDGERVTDAAQEGYHRCDDRPLLLFVNDGEVEEGFCGKHIRKTWLDELRV